MWFGGFIRPANSTARRNLGCFLPEPRHSPRALLAKASDGIRGTIIGGISNREAVAEKFAH
jgi:hypothetical protein